MSDLKGVIKIQIKVEEGSFLHIGAAPSPLTEKKGAIFKIDRMPVIPASSFKGALRHQLEELFINKLDEFTKLFDVEDNKKELLRPCIPSPSPTKAEQQLLESGRYRGKMEGKKYKDHCEIKVDNYKVEVGDLGICPVCYFMGATGIMGFLRVSNFMPKKEGNIIDQTNIRIDRQTETAANSAKVDTEQVKPETVFEGTVEIVDSPLQGFTMGMPREIDGKVLDKWMVYWKKKDKETLVNEILLPAIKGIKILGGQKSKGAGKVIVTAQYEKAGVSM